MRFLDAIFDLVVYVCMMVFVLMCFAPVFCLLAAFVWLFMWIANHIACGV